MILRGEELRPFVGSASLMLRIRNPDQGRLPTPALLRKLLRITPAEARVVLAIMGTDDQDQAAAQLEVAKPTLRTHLQHVYQTLGIHGRAELLQLLAAYGFRQAPDPE